MSDDNSPPEDNVSRVNPLKLAKRKKPRAGDPLVHHGRHFGRTVYAMCSVHALFTSAIARMGEDEDVAEELLTFETRKEHRVYQKLSQLVPRLSERLMAATEEDIMVMAEFLQKGVSTARSDDTKSLKSIVVDWITPRDAPLLPPLSRNVKTNRGFHHPVTGRLLCPAGLDWSDDDIRKRLASGELAIRGDQWPLLLYENEKYDPEDPWNGLFRNHLLVWAFKHIFTSPSSVEKEVKATRSGNARIHGMTRVTTASLAYVATQLRFALSSSSVFCRNDTSTDSERFYESVLDFLDHPEEQDGVRDLLRWWNSRIFPSYVSREQVVSKDGALAKLTERRALRQLENTAPS